MVICAQSACPAQCCRLRNVRLAYLANTALPSTGHPAPIRALRHPWLARRSTSEARLDDRCCLLLSNKSFTE